MTSVTSLESFILEDRAKQLPSRVVLHNKSQSNHAASVLSIDEELSTDPLWSSFAFEECEGHDSLSTISLSCAPRRVTKAYLSSLGFVDQNPSSNSKDPPVQPQRMLSKRSILSPANNLSHSEHRRRPPAMPIRQSSVVHFAAATTTKQTPPAPSETEAMVGIPAKVTNHPQTHPVSIFIGPRCFPQNRRRQSSNSVAPICAFSGLVL